jgi:hypothetical protein
MTIRYDFRLNTKLLMNSIADFIKGRFYQLNIHTTTLTEYDTLPFNAENIVHYCHKRILILPYGSASQISKVWEHMESLGCNDLYLLIQDARRNLFPNIPSDRIISFDDKQTPWEYLKLLIRISAGKYVLAVSPTSLALPFSYAFKSCLCFDSESKQFYQSRETRKCLWKLFVSFFAGELIALALLPVFYVKSKKYFLKQK